MRKHVKSISLLLILGLIIVFTQFVSVSAMTASSDIQSRLKNAVALYIGSEKAYAKNAVTYVDSNPSVVPVVKNSRTLVPVSFITANFGATLSWDKKTASIVITAGSKTIKLKLGSKKMIVNNKEILLDVPAGTINNRTFIPLSRLAIDALGKQVFYNRGLIIISDKVNIVDKVKEKDMVDRMIAMLDQSLFPVKAAGKIGYMNKSGKVIIKPQFDKGGQFSEGRASVMVSSGNDEKWGFINKQGKFIVTPQYSQVENFSSGMARVMSADKLYGYVNLDGVSVIKPQYTYAESFCEGLAVVQDVSTTAGADGKYGYINKDGKWTIDPKYDAAKSFSEGIASVQVDGNWGFIDKTGKISIETKFLYAEGFSNGLAYVIGLPDASFKWGYINKTGTAVIKFDTEPVYDTAGYFKEGMAKAFIPAASSSENSKWGFIDTNGKYAITPQFELVRDFSEGLACVKDGSKYGYVDKNGKVIIPPKFDKAAEFYDGLAFVIQNEADGNNKWGYINKAGKYVWAPQK